MAVIGGDERQTEVFLQTKQPGMDAVLHLKTLILNFQEEILPAEYVAVARRRLRAASYLSSIRYSATSPFKTSRKGNQSLSRDRQEMLCSLRGL
jgi:hypothetical protein